MSMIEVVTVRGAMALMVPPQGDHQQRFIPLSGAEAHDLMRKLAEGISHVNAYDEHAKGEVPDPRPARGKGNGKRGRPRAK